MVKITDKFDKNLSIRQNVFHQFFTEHGAAILLFCSHIKYKLRLETTFININFFVKCKNLTIRQYFILMLYVNHK